MAAWTCPKIWGPTKNMEIKVWAQAATPQSSRFRPLWSFPAAFDAQKYPQKADHWGFESSKIQASSKQALEMHHLSDHISLSYLLLAIYKII
jgi:hypothetical protein